jgi:hypothetical protein
VCSSDLDFYFADAEAEYEYSKCGACVDASDWWTSKFRELRPSFQAAVTSYGRTDLADVYWMTWRDRGFHFLPQAYWNDPNMAATFMPSACVDVGRVCPNTPEAANHGFDCTGSPTDCPCWPVDTIHPMIGYGWGQSPPTADDYVADLATAHSNFGSIGFSIFEGQYLPAASAAWTTFGQAIASGAIAITP